jgi:hypothetical protein
MADALSAVESARTPNPGAALLGYIQSVHGSQASISLLPHGAGPSRAGATVGKFVKIHTGKAIADRSDHRCRGRTDSQGPRPLRHRQCRPHRRDQRSRWGAFPPRHRGISDHRRSGQRADQQRAAAGVRSAGSQDAAHRPAAAGSQHRRRSRHRGIAEQAFCRARHHRRRQVQRGGADPAADHAGAAQSARAAARRAQRIRPLLRRARQYRHTAQSEAAVLAVQFRGDRRHHLRRPSGVRRRGRHSRRGHSASQGRLYAIPRRRSTPRMSATPSTRRCRTGSPICSARSTSAWASWRTAPRASSITS